MHRNFSRRNFLRNGLKSAMALLLGRFTRGLSTSQPNSFVHSVWSGAIEPTAAQVRARIDHDSDLVRLVVSTNLDLADPVYSTVSSASINVNNRMVTLPITGLQPDTQYYFAVESNGIVDSEVIGRFRTPAAPSQFSFTIAFSACAETASNHPVFDTIREHNPLFFLHMGDMHYEDIGTNDRSRFRQAFDTVLSQPKQAALYQNVPIVYMWDDHDYGPNDSDLTAPGREAARLTYREYVPHYPLAAGSGDNPIYQAFTIGRVRFILTDTRSERTPKNAPDNVSKTMLGATQKAWFKDELLKAKNTQAMIVWVSTSPWIADPPGSGDDNWAGYTTERRELADFIQVNEINSLFMLSGDVHMVAIDDGRNNIYASKGGRGFPVMQAAPLDRNNPSWLPGNTYSEGQYPSQNQFALMTITDDGGPFIHVHWSGRDHQDNEFVWLEMTLPPSPRLSASPDELFFIYAEHGQRFLLRTLTISNVNVGSFDWTMILESPAPWLNLSRNSGTAVAGAPQEVQVIVDPAGVEPGIHQTTLSITAEQALHSPQLIPVTFLYTDSPSSYLPTLNG